MTGPREFNIGKYRVLIGMTSADYLAQAYLGRKSLLDARGHSYDEAAKALRLKLRDRDDKERAARIEKVPTAREYLEALNIISEKLEPQDMAMLRAHVNARGDGKLFEDYTLSLGEIAAAGGSGDYNDALKIYDNIGRKLADYIDYFDPRDYGAPISYSWAFMLVTGDINPSAGPILLQMRPQVVTALYDAGLAFVSV